MFKLYWQKFIVPHWEMVLLALICFIIASIAGLLAPLVIKFLIDDALIAGDEDFLHLIIAGVIGLYLLRGIFSYIYGQKIAKAGNLMLAKLRQRMFERLQQLDYAYFINTSTGEIISLFTNDLGLIQQAVSVAVPDLLVESLNLIAILMIMIYFDWQLALVTFATLPFIILATSFFNEKISGLGKLVEETLGEVTSILHQALLSVKVVQSYVREEYESQKFCLRMRHAAGDFIKVQRLKAILIALVEFLASIGLTGIIWYGGREVINDKLTIGGMFAFLIYIINIPTPIRKISEAVSSMKLGIVAWQRVSSLERETKVVFDGKQEIDKVMGKVEFRDVNFEYLPELGTLRGINFIIRPGDMVAIVGPSGAGKSSFANLLLRFYDPISGVILLDDLNIKEIKMSCLRKQIGFIQQQPILFNISILENIRYGRPNATFDEVKQAAKLANAHDFIMNLPGGYDYIVGELGNNVSGGQRQRIAIARAIIVEPPILLLDEPTAALDTEAEKLVMESIRKVSKNRTTFLITHRLSSLLDSDKVICLMNGRITEAGTHAELVERGGVYAKAVFNEEMQA
ncbi:ABC transporter ATP-binding protein [Pelosinus sp. UFO1]|uniref:ABC transporter ATP-binding protein n=1 Tax=Pelosinus sp. UFO1 TaxID=484770 RepID=UPI0004D11984|nr:ABC transporter ATP-binding protein [Pelosinus sp. UFO1]AIF52208.1 Xenobiotic-transporting ATPase [Pelosinus sp. UFO1]